MIKLTKTIPDIGRVNAAYVKVLCHFAAYGEYEKIGLFWVQTDECDTPTAVISCIDGVMTVSAGNADFEELKQFVMAISPNGIFTDIETAQKLDLKIETECTTLKRKPPFESEKVIENTYCGVEYLYNTLATGLNLGDKTAFIADVSHRLRHNCASYVTSDFSAAAILYSGEYAMINGIAVKPGNKRKGLGTTTLNRLLQGVKNRTVFVCAEEKNVPFYLKNGFTPDDKSAYCRL